MISNGPYTIKRNCDTCLGQRQQWLEEKAAKEHAMAELVSVKARRAELEESVQEFFIKLKKYEVEIRTYQA